MAAERKEPDVLISSSGLTGVVGDIQADPDTKSGAWTAADPLRATGNNVSVNIHCSFPSPSDNLTVGADLQEFRVLLRPFDSGHTGDPDWRIELRQNGSLVRAGSNTEILNDAGDTVVAFTWNANELTSDPGGVQVEIKVFGVKTGGSSAVRNTIDIGAAEWNVDYTSGPQTITGTVGEIASGEVFEADNAIALVTPQSISGTVGAIASGEAFEVDGVVSDIVLAITGAVGEIASGEVFETDNKIQFPAQEIGPAGDIASGEALEVNNRITERLLISGAGGIASNEAFESNNVIALFVETSPYLTKSSMRMGFRM